MKQRIRGRVNPEITVQSSNRKHEVAHDAFGIVRATEDGSRWAYMYDEYNSVVVVVAVLEQPHLGDELA